jgi:hypothetical protein
MGEDLSPSQPNLTPQQPGLGEQEIPSSAVNETSEEEKDKALRARNPQPPLTEDDIAKLTVSRGRRPTEDEIDGMNQARAQGIHTSIV